MDLGLTFLMKVVVHIVSYCPLNIHLIIVEDTLTDPGSDLLEAWCAGRASAKSLRPT